MRPAGFFLSSVSTASATKFVTLRRRSRLNCVALPCAEGADQRAHAVGGCSSRMPDERCERARTRSSVLLSGISPAGLCRPFVDHQQGRLDSARRNPAVPRCVPGCHWASVESATMRSVIIGRPVLLDGEQNPPCARSREKIECSVFQQTLPGTCSIRVVRGRALHALIGCINADCGCCRCLCANEREHRNLRRDRLRHQLPVRCRLLIGAIARRKADSSRSSASRQCGNQTVIAGRPRPARGAEQGSRVASV